MQFFTSDDPLVRIGDAIGAIIAVSIYATLVLVILNHYLFH